MPIAIDPQLGQAIERNPGAITVQVEGGAPDLVTQALRSARLDILRLDGGWQSAPGLDPTDRNGPKFVSGVMPAEPGPLIWVDGGSTPLTLLQRIPEIVASHLATVGVTDARVSAVTSSPPLLHHATGMATASPGMVLRLYPDPPARRPGVPTPVPVEWLSRALRWLLGETGGGRGLQFVHLTQFPVAAEDAGRILEQTRERGMVHAYLVGGEPIDRLALIEGHFMAGNIAMGIAGRLWSQADILRVAEDLKNIAREVRSEVAVAFISIEPVLGANIAAEPFVPMDRVADRLHTAPGLVAPVCDELTFDGYYYQLIGPGHIRRLGQLPSDAVALPGGKAELTFGRADQWLPSSPARHELHELSRRTLRPLLVSRQEVAALWRERWGPPRLM